MMRSTWDPGAEVLGSCLGRSRLPLWGFPSYRYLGEEGAPRKRSKFHAFVPVTVEDYRYRGSCGLQDCCDNCFILSV